MDTLQSYTLPVSQAIKRLRAADFSLETRDKVCLYEDPCTLVLFYTETPESKRILSIFKTVAETVAGPVFAACNVLLENQVAEAFMDVYNIRDHPFSWTGSRPFPFILIYRRGYPVNFYDGPADIPILTNFALNVACSPEFHMSNYSFTEMIRSQMWSNYRERHGIVIGGPGRVTTTQPVAPSLPAVPYNRIRNIN
jgi:hypothetical protein